MCEKYEGKWSEQVSPTAHETDAGAKDDPSVHSRKKMKNHEKSWLAEIKTIHHTAYWGFTAASYLNVLSYLIWPRPGSSKTPHTDQWSSQWH